MRRFKVVLEWDEGGPGYVVRVPALPGCLTQGGTREEALARIRDAIEGHLEALAAMGEPIPRGDVDVSVEEVELRV